MTREDGRREWLAASSKGEDLPMPTGPTTPDELLHAINEATSGSGSFLTVEGKEGVMSAVHEYLENERAKVYANGYKDAQWADRGEPDPVLYGNDPVHPPNVQGPALKGWGK